MIGKMFGIIFQPTSTWQTIAEMPESTLRRYLAYPAILALLPAIAWYFGTTEAGWMVMGHEVQLSDDSAANIWLLFYLTELVVIGVIGYSIHWMATTYGAESSTSRGIVIASFCATPLFLFGLFGFAPQMWIDFLVGLAALSYAVFLLYSGIPIVMKIPTERGFLFASAVIAIGMVMIVVSMVAMALLWDMGFGPTFSDH